MLIMGTMERSKRRDRRSYAAEFKSTELPEITRRRRSGGAAKATVVA